MGLQMALAITILTGLLYNYFRTRLDYVKDPKLFALCYLTIYAQTTSIPAEVRLGDPWESRTPAFAVKGRRLSRLTKGPNYSSSYK